MLKKKCMELLSFGENYLFASLLYFGLGLLVLGLAPSMSSVNAAGEEIECPEGQVPVWSGENNEICECECPDPDEDE